MLLLNGVVEDQTVAVRMQDQIVSTLFYAHPREVCNFFSPLVRHAETLFATGEAPYPIERNLLTTGLCIGGVTSLHNGGARVPTPHLARLAYTAPAASGFMNAPVVGGNPLPLPPGPEAGINGAIPQLARRKRIALIGTIWSYSSHVDHMSNRFLSGYPMNGAWHWPEMDIVSAWIHQSDDHPQAPAGDLAASRAEEHGIVLYDSIAEALCCGGEHVAVDCVCVIAEHGDYPLNPLGQKMYPRHLWFAEVARVLEADNAQLPIFSDKHLSYSFVEAERMVAKVTHGDTIICCTPL